MSGAVKIHDGTAGPHTGIAVAVKKSGASALATDNALVVTLSPGSGGIGLGLGTGLSPAAPTTGTALTLQSGATSQTLFTAGEVIHGCVIANGLSAADEGGIAAAESIWVDFTGAAAASGGGNTSVQIQPGQSISFPGGLATSVHWIATTVNHKISAYKY